MLWQQCLKHLEQELPDQEINTWLRTLHGTHQDDALFLLAPNEFVLQHVRKHHLSRINECARNITTNQTIQVFLKIGSSIPVINKESKDSFSSNNQRSFSAQSTARQITAASGKIDPSLGIQHLFTNSLSPAMTFENFVEGKSNQLARASSLQVTENPGKSYNPLFIYGSSGLGKTHILHAIGNRILEHNSRANVVYLAAENFVNDLVRALRNNKVNEFKTFYRSADALLIDDIQFFAGKTRSMEEFFYTFNALLEDQKQIILTSDQYPRNVEGLDDRLRTRLNSGLSVSIDPPDLETRVAILRKKSESFSLILPNDVAFFIARRFSSNVRDLEGALKKVVATLRFRKQNELTLDFVHHALRDQLANRAKLVNVANIKKIVAQHYNIRVSDLDASSRVRVIARPRQIAMSLAKELTDHSYPEIGQHFGGRDHTTVMHAGKKVTELRRSDPQIEEDYNILYRILTS